MKWVTRARPKTDRVACPWLIKRFVDTNAEIIYSPADAVLRIAGQEEATSFDAPGATYDHRGAMCTFEVFIEEFKLGADPHSGGSRVSCMPQTSRRTSTATR